MAISFLFSLFIISLCQSAIITPTFDDGTIQIYNASKSALSKSDYIICGTSICHLICELNGACDFVKVNATNANELILECTSETACKYLEITVPPKNVANITCKGQESCSRTYFNLNNVPLVHLNCSNDEEVTPYYSGACYDTILDLESAANVFINFTVWSCFNAHFYGENVTNNLTIIGTGSSTIGYSIGLYLIIYCPLDAPCNIICNEDGCSSVVIHVENRLYPLNLQCNGTSAYACSAAQIICSDTGYVTKMLYNYQHGYNKWECSSYGSSGCCPFDAVQGTYQCAANSMCLIDCSQTDCYHFEIDGTQASSLTVDCLSTSISYACQAIQIKCPTQINSACEVICGGGICEYMFIETKVPHTLNISCLQSSSCSNARIVLDTYNDLDSESTEWNLQCNGMYSCSYMELYLSGLTSKASISCQVKCQHAYSCVGMVLYGNNTQWLDVMCAGNYSCYLMDIYCPYQKKGACNVQCNNYKESCYMMDIFVNDDFIMNYLNISCPTTDIHDACNQLRIHCNTKEIAQFIFHSTHNEYECQFNSSSYCCPYVTALPTISPIMPTQRPINHPSTFSPTENPITITITPTKQIQAPSMSATDSSKATTSTSTSSSTSSSPVIIGIVITIGIFIMLILLFIYLFQRKRNKLNEASPAYNYIEFKEYKEEKEEKKQYNDSTTVGKTFVYKNIAPSAPSIANDNIEQEPGGNNNNKLSATNLNNEGLEFQGEENDNLRLWFYNKVDLENVDHIQTYLDLFRKNGFNTTNMVKQYVTNKDMLQEIGINVLLHRLVIMDAIKKLD